MKNSLKYLKLWQKKRDELHVDADGQADWLLMQSLLDKHMPVVKPPAGLHTAPIKGFKLMSLLWTTVAAAAITGAVWYGLKAYKHNKPKQNVTQASPLNKPDSLVAVNSHVELTKPNNPDSLLAVASGASSLANGASATVAQGSLNDKKETNNGSAVNKSAAKLNGKSNSVTVANAGGPKVLSTRFSDKKGNSRPATTNGVSPHSTTQNNRPLSSAVIGESQKSHQNSTARVKNRVSGSTNDGQNRPGDGGKILDDYNYRNTGFLQAMPPKPNFSLGGNDQLTIARHIVNNKSLQIPQTSKSNKNNGKTKTRDSKPSSPSNLEWGLQTGFNSAGSFTSKAQNSNFYGSLPVDPFFGLFANYNLNDNWAIDAQIRALNPQKISGSYNHANGSKVDTGQMIKVTDSRKAYTVDIPLHLIYKVNDRFSIKAGPVFSIPVKQLKGSASLQPAAIATDTNYYKTAIRQIDSVKYQPKFNYGISAGASYQVNRFVFGIDYLKNLGGYQVNSGFGNYKSHNGTVQITIGFKLGKK